MYATDCSGFRSCDPQYPMTTTHGSIGSLGRTYGFEHSLPREGAWQAAAREVAGSQCSLRVPRWHSLSLAIVRATKMGAKMQTDSQIVCISGQILLRLQAWRRTSGRRAMQSQRRADIYDIIDFQSRLLENLVRYENAMGIFDLS